MVLVLKPSKGERRELRGIGEIRDEVVEAGVVADQDGGAAGLAQLAQRRPRAARDGAS